MLALRQGALQIGEDILSKAADARPFEDFVTIFYDNKIETKVLDDLEAYKKYINGTNARAQTDFVICF